MGPRPRAPDGQLLRRAGRGPEAFGELYERHETIVAGYLVRQTRDPELAADLTSETFSTALLNAERFRDDENPRSAGCWASAATRSCTPGSAGGPNAEPSTDSASSASR